MDRERIKAYMRWTTRRFKDNTVEIVWSKIQGNPKMMKEYLTFDTLPSIYAHSTANLRFALKNYGWKDLMKSLWILATEKENTMFMNGLIKEQEKWIKVKDKLAQMPRNVQQ